MTMNRRRLLASGAAAFAMTLASGRIALAQSADEINILSVVPLTGPVAHTGQAEQLGWADAIDYINSTGGVAGRKLNVSVVDSEYKVDVGLAHWKRGLADGKYQFVKVDNTGLARAMAPENNERYKMLVGMSATPSGLKDTAAYPHFFIPGSNYEDLMAVILSWIGEQANGKKPRIALVYSATEFGRDPIALTKERIAGGDFELVLEDETPFTAVDVTANVIKIRNAKPDYVIFHGYAANVWPEMSRLIREYGIDAQLIVTSYACDPHILKSVGESANGVIGCTQHTLAVGGSDQPVLKAIDAALKARDPAYDGLGSIGYIFSWANALIFREAAAACINAGEELTGDNLIRAVQNIKDWDSGGVFPLPVTFRDNRVPSAVLYRFGVTPEKVTLEHIASVGI